MMGIKPVLVWESAFSKLALKDVQTAMAFLTFEWPEQFCGTRLQLGAQLIGLAALDGKIPAALFRTSLIEAAAEADILALRAEPPPLLDLLLATRVSR